MHNFSTMIASNSQPLFNAGISTSPDELPARLAMISIPERPEMMPMPVSPEASPLPPQRTHSGKRLFQMSSCGMEIERKAPQKTHSYKKRRSTSYRRVHFQMNQESGRIVRRSVYGRVTLTEEEKQALWWDKPTLRKSAKQSLREFKANEHCEGPSFEDFRQRYRMVMDKVASNSMEGCAEEMNLSDSPIRGLEQHVFPETMAAKQSIIRKVVAAQDRLPSQLPPEQQSKLLRAASQNLTKSSRLLARLKGMGDASIAALEHQ